MTAYSSGGSGDIVFQIKIMKLLEVNRLYIMEAHYNDSTTIASTVGSLLISQGIESYPVVNDHLIMVDYNLDKFREEKQYGHLIKRMLLKFGLPIEDWKTPWLKDIHPVKSSRFLVNITPRWREGSSIDWKKTLQFIRSELMFIGFEDEYNAFCKEVFEIPYLHCNNLLEMSQYVNGCEALYCNQSAALAIAQGLGKKYFLEHKPGKFNCLMNTGNENILK
jgi:hypothetical protein